ncbi:zinc ribbon domain-containing protein [Candidatus Bathyarchaeota archaeon]|nr:zinc ribbon domain-containing protein [Candidatus Bathyarchaeota archaeon]
MAITRCPYCHAIIDENVKYCNNCGTQLLFTEDADVEEEIPGEKIIDADTEEKDYTVEEPEGESKPKEDRDVDEELEEEAGELALDKLVAEAAAEDDVTEEVILVDEIEAVEAGSKDEPKEPGGKEKASDIMEPDKDEDEEKEEKEEEKADEEGEEKEAEKESGEKEDTAELKNAEEKKSEEAGPQPVTFDTQELEGIGKTVELGKEQIDKFLEVLAKKEAEVEPPPKTAREPSGTLPPWASTMKGAPVFPDETGPVGALDKGVADTTAPAFEEEVEIFPRRKDSDSTIGLPERVSQSPLPFEPGAAEEVEEEEGEPAEGEAREKMLPTAGPVRPVRESERREAEAEEEGEEPEPRPPFSFSVFFKSKAFDVLFVGLFWLVALWLAANSMGATLFDILGSMSGSMLLLYAVFVFIYFFLFKFFLGETLGDRLFRERE